MDEETKKINDKLAMNPNLSDYEIAKPNKD